jgi:hypothetical protein
MFYAMGAIGKRFKNAAANGGRQDETFLEFQSRMRLVESNQAAAYGNNKDKDKKDDKKKDKKDKNTTTPRPARTPRAVDTYFRNDNQFKAIKKANVCARCLKPGHLPNEDSAPCKGKPQATFRAEDFASVVTNGPEPPVNEAGNE